MYGTPPALISPSCATLARMYPLSGRRSAPTTDRATWCPTPAAFSAASRLRVEVSKNSITAASAKDGEFDTSTTTCAPASASASPSPVRALTPDEGDAGTASWPRSAEDRHQLLPDEPAAADHHDLHDESPVGAFRRYSTSATDQRASLSGLAVMYTARTPPSMRRATT